ncbi:MAG TPA: 4Fe-4S dicluster domain-containing protein, partial [Rudaea sp.]|nr:4Fe-4S dicluster domain-containing protein [Rudaea sp.]
ADTAVWDGRYANNAWLQEMPRPFSELTWGNAVLVSPALGLGDGDVVELRFHGRTLLAPAMVQPGQAEDSVCLALGYGRRGAGHVGDGVGVDAYTLRTADAPWFGAGLTLRRTGAREALACTQRHFELDGGDPVRRLRYAEYRAHPEAARREEKARSLYAEFPRGEHAWAMSIDLGACIGCKACVVACQAENNVPVVGAEQVRRGREMHWLRVDRYYEGTAERPRCYHQPVPCMHCEHAPCELVCPVEATVHDSEGLNVQVYNRCIGTRFCSNNCPYKVRRFNFLRYPEPAGENAPALHNPQVSVRRSGVMEKCTFCIQRIAAARSDADAGGRPLADGDVVTACQAACPTRAIRFGDLADPASEVSAAKRSPLDYALLGELNTRPRTTYLARVTDARPGLEDV